MDFSEWIVSELEQRGWSRSEAARRGSISPSMFDKVINGHAKPGVKFIEGIAQAFKVTPAEVMMRIKDYEETDEDEYDRRIKHLLKAFPIEEKKKIVKRLELEAKLNEQRPTTKPSNKPGTQKAP